MRAVTCARRHPWLVLSTVIVIGGPGPLGAATVPDWMAALASSPTPPAASGADAYVLLLSRHVTVQVGKNVLTTERGVLRVLNPRGGEAATCTVPYLKATSTVVSLKAWVLRPDGRVEALGGGDALDRSLVGAGQLATDWRERVLAAANPPPEALFGWEWTVEERPLVAEWSWPFQWIWPTARARFALTLPQGLTPSAHVFNIDSLPAFRDGDTWVWEARDLPALKVEPMAPAPRAVVPWIGVSARARKGDNPAGLDFARWEDVAKWLQGLAESYPTDTPELRDRASALTRSSTTSLERIRAIGRYVQSLNYVGIEVGVGFGEGFRPRAANEVLHTGYGDCKDKANLMRALLARAGFDAWLLAVYSGEPGHVRESWPSPSQFNHCIVAVRAPEGDSLPARLGASPVGPILVFDPTDPNTPLGDLPEPEQGSWALIETAAANPLFRLPVATPEVNREEIHIDGTLDDSGGLAASVHVRSLGKYASAHRRRLGEPLGYREWTEKWVAATGGGVELDSIIPRDRLDDRAFELDLTFRAPRFARSMGGRLLTFRAGVLRPGESWTLTDSVRRSPIQLGASSFAESVLIRLPTGWTVDELPEAVEMRADFGFLLARWSGEPGAVRFVREWVTRPVVLPPERYADVVRFQAARSRAGQAAVVLARR